MKIITYYIEREKRPVCRPIYLTDFIIHGHGLIHCIKSFLFRRIFQWCQPEYLATTGGELKRTVINGDKLFDMIRSHVRDIANLDRHQPIHLVIGFDQWRQIIEDAYANPYASGMDLHLQLSLNIGRYDRKLIGCRVTIVPWIDGFFVMPIETETVKPRQSAY